ncbi:helix-turn-helix domain-containing protein [Nonomuraea antimicrobica]
MPTREMADFLRSRRDRIRPETVGLPANDRRRAPGLRRAEVAQLAGISPDYYMRLEQGRSVRPSSSVLDALARALLLNPDERDHLYRLAQSEPAPLRRHEEEQVPRPSTGCWNSSTASPLTCSTAGWTYSHGTRWPSR